jgi:hypothetical protein
VHAAKAAAADERGKGSVPKREAAYVKGNDLFAIKLFFFVLLQKPKIPVQPWTCVVSSLTCMNHAHEKQLFVPSEHTLRVIV